MTSVNLIEDANQPMYNLTVAEVHTFAVGEGDWVVHNTCDLSKLQKKLEPILSSEKYGISSFQCHQCANRVGSILRDSNYTVDIVRIENLPDPIFGRVFENMTVMLPSGKRHIIGDSGWHEAVRISMNGQEYFVDSLVYTHKGVEAVLWDEYLSFWEGAQLGPTIHVVSSRSVP